MITKRILPKYSIGLLILVIVGGIALTGYHYRNDTSDTSEHVGGTVLSDLFTFVEKTVTGTSTKESSEVIFNEETSEQVLPDSDSLAIITLAGGCFWCTEAFFQEAVGVVDAVSGYAGGDSSTATYKQVASGYTKHREAVQVVYDPSQISVKDLLNIYWAHIDPTDTGGQFADRGYHYTTAIYYHDDSQKQIALTSKNNLARSGLFDKAIATEILQFVSFYPAEEYHQDYYKKSSAHYERYKKASGRAGFIEDNWAKEAALQFFEGESKPQAIETMTDITVYTPRIFSVAEIEAGQKELTATSYDILVKENTESPYKNAYYDNKEAGIYVDLITGRPLFSSAHKYDSGTGWPSFYKALPEAQLVLKTDTKLFYTRTEVRSESGHLGHVFEDGPVDKGGKRYCINSGALKFISENDMKNEGYGEYLDLLYI